MRKTFLFTSFLVLAASFGTSSSVFAAGSLSGYVSSYTPGPSASPNNSPSSGIVNITLPSSGSNGINTTYLQGYATSIIDTINGLIVPTLLAVAFLFFIWGVVNYFVFGAANDKKREEGRNFILWSIIGFVVIFSVWGLVGLVGSTFSLSPGGSAPSYPTL